MVDILVSHSDNAESTGSQDGITLDIRCNLLLMNAAIDFHDNAGAMAIKVNDE